MRGGKILNAQRKPTKYIIRPAALEAAVSEGLFENKAVFIDHAGFFENLPWRSQGPSIRNLAGGTQEGTYNPIQQSVEGIIKLSNTPAGTVISDLLDELLADGEHAPDIGLSLVFYPTWEGNEITAIQHVESVDLVFQPAADGRILQALSSIHDVNPVHLRGSQPMELIPMPENRATYQTNSDPPVQPEVPVTPAPPNPAHLREAAPPSNDMAEWHRLQAIYAARQEDLAIVYLV